MSRKLVIPGVTFTGPRLKADPIESAGSLLLIEPGHPATPWAAGVPANGAALPNVVATAAAPMIGTGTPTFVVAGAGLTGTKGKLERTSKGGLHAIASQTALADGDGAYIEFPLSLIQYMLTNPQHTYLYSVWERITRQYGSAAQPARLFVAAGDQTKSHAYIYKNNMRPAGAPARVAVSNLDTTVNPDTPQHRWAAVSRWQDGGAAVDAPGWAATDVERRYKFGAVGYGNTGTYRPSVPSVAVYRIYVEDLTVSGRSYADAAAQEAALFTAAFGAGGRYAADTFTAPSTIA